MDVLLWLGVAYLAIRVITKKRLRDLKIRWSFVLLAIGLGPFGYFAFGWLEREGYIQEIYAGHAYIATFGGTFGMILFSPWFLIGAVILYFLERRARKQETGESTHE
jgi:hypothetical protein